MPKAESYVNTKAWGQLNLRLNHFSQKSCRRSNENTFYKQDENDHSL